VNSMASGVPEGSEPSFSARRLRLAMLLQCAPSLCVAGAIIDAAFNLPASAPGLRWPLEILCLSALLAGVGYAAVGRRLRFRSASLLGACRYMTLQFQVLGGNSTVGVPAAILLLGLVAATTADLLRLLRRGGVEATLPGTGEIFGTILFSVLAAAFIILGTALVVDVYRMCVPSGPQCDTL
jgi:hypothetical protein